MKTITLFLICILGLTACTKSYEQMFVDFVTRELPNRNQYSHYIIIPGAGCEGCISGTEYFVKENYQRADILYIFTNIESVKILKFKLGKDLIESSNVIIDTENKFNRPTNDVNSIYPMILAFENNKVTQISYVSPEDLFSLENLQNKLKEQPIYKVDLESYIKTKETSSVQLSDLTDSICYIPLKTPDNLPVADLMMLKVTDAYIFYLDINQKLFMFNRDGDFLCLIGHKGEGPDEYLNVTGFDVDAELGEIYLHDLQKYIIFTYKTDGSIKKNIEIDKSILNVSRFYAGGFVGYTPEYYSVGKEKLLFFDSLGIKQDSLLFDKKDITVADKIDLFKMATFNYTDKFTYTLPFDDVTYIITPVGNTYKYSELYQGKYKLPSNIGLSVELYNKNLNNAYIFEPHAQFCKSICFVDFFFQMENYRLVYNFETKQFGEVFKGKYRKGIKNNIDNGASIWPAFIYNDVIVSVFNPADLDENIANETTQKLYESFAVYDNPVLQLVKIKDDKL